MIPGLTSRHTIQRVRPIVSSDGRAGFNYDYDGVDPVDLQGWALDAGATTEDLQNRDGVEISWTARGPFGADVERHDRIIVFGAPFRIVGAVLRQPGPTGLTSHTILGLANWEG